MVKNIKPASAAAKTLVQPARVRANTTKDSVRTIDGPVVEFSDLRDDDLTGNPYKPAPGDKGATTANAICA